MVQAVLPRAGGRCIPIPHRRQPPPPKVSPEPQTRLGAASARCPSQPRFGQIRAGTSLLLLLSFYLHWDTISDKASVGRFLWQPSQTSDYKLTLAYPTPRLADYFKGTGSPPASSAQIASFQGSGFGRAFYKVHQCHYLHMAACEEESGLLAWQAQTSGWANLMETEVLRMFQIIIVCSQGSKIVLRSWTFLLLLLSFETRVFSKGD